MSKSSLTWSALVLSVALASGFALTTPSLAAEPAAETQAMQQPLPLSVGRVADNMGKPGVYVFDCNPKDLYEKSHVPGATPINVADWQKLLPKDKKDTFLIFYCVNRMCNVSWEIASETLKLGYQNVYVMPDGIQSWIQHGMKYEGTSVGQVERQAEIDKRLQEEMANRAKR